uniref:ULP_PROTEASE domain-containing protein n=1 Tax=Panagrellus redivivus TaxID=6233 RepID=A0A7E4VQA5_PANRE
MSFWRSKEDLKSDFSEGLFALPKRRRIESDDCEIIGVVAQDEPLTEQVPSTTPSYPFLGNFDFSKLRYSVRESTRIRDKFANSSLFDFDAKTKYAKLLADQKQASVRPVSSASSTTSSNLSYRRRPVSSFRSADVSGFAKLFDTSSLSNYSREPSPPKMGGVTSRFSFLRNKPSNESLADSLEQLEQFVDAARLPPESRPRLVDYDDSVVSDALEISERFSSSYIDEKFKKSPTPKRVIEVQPIPIDEDILNRGLDNSKLNELELERLERQRIRDRENKERAEELARLTRENIENEKQRLSGEISADQRNSIYSGLDHFSIVLDLPSAEESFPPLPEEANEFIDIVWNRRLPQDEVLVDANPFKIHRKDLHTLSGLNWLNDEIINFYFNLIVQRATAEDADLPKVYAFQTFFYTTLCSKGYPGVKRWTRKVDVFAHDLWLIPVHLSVHWCLAVVDVANQAIFYYDSMLGKNSDVFDLLLDYIQSEHKDKKKQDLDVSKWRTCRLMDIPTQQNGSDCGMFACKFAEYASRRAEIDFTQKHMPYFRKRMVWEICQQQLM